MKAELARLLGRFVAEKRALGASEKTLSQRREVLGLFFRYITHEIAPPVTCVGGISSDHLTAYRDHLFTRERMKSDGGRLSIASLITHLAGLKAFFGFAAESGAVLVDPALALKYPRRPRRLPREVPSVRQMRRLLSLARERRAGTGLRDAAILELFYSSGLRNGELCGLKLKDYDRDRGVAFVERGKGGKDRVVPVGAKAQEALSRYLDTRGNGNGAGDRGGPLFLSVCGTPMTIQAVQHLLRRALSRARIAGKITPHTLRHACATHLLQGRADIRHIQALLGHESLRTTEIYTRVDMTDLKRVLARCHPREVANG